METLAYLHHSTAFENPEEYEISFDWDQVNLLDGAAASKLSTKGAMYLLAATCGLGITVASEEAKAVLFPGDLGPAVYDLQVELLNAGYSVPGAPSTYYGPATTAAVRQLQADCGISVDGIFGSASEACLYGGGGPVGGGLLRFGSQGQDVYDWQVALIDAGYSIPNGPSVYFGSQTDAATRRLQADCGIAVDGIVGPATRACVGSTNPGPIGGGLLRYGSTGADVTAWQNALISAGYSVPGAPSTFFGNSTEAATRQLQADCGITADGIVGPNTRACISGGPTGGTTLFPGNTGAAVVALQQELIAKAWLSPGLATGFYGPQTEDAVRRLQLACGVAVDGIAGPQTRTCLATI